MLLRGISLIFCTFLTHHALANNCQQTNDAEISSLLSDIHHHKTLYEQGLQPEITDYQYDLLVEEYMALTGCNKLPDALSTRQKAEQQRTIPMTGLHKATDVQQVMQFLRKVEKESEESSIIVQPKIDGIALEVIWKNGELFHASTRGDGWYGSDVTQMLRRSQVVPERIPFRSSLIARGELYASASCVAAFKRYADARHFAAGVIQADRATPEKLACLRFAAWQWLSCPLAEEWQCLNFLEEQKIKTVAPFSSRHHFDESLRMNVTSAYQHFMTSIERYGFMTDGIVIKANNLTVQQRLATSARGPDWALAWKYQHPGAITTIRAIQFKQGRTGRVTPVIEIEPVVLQGKTISRLSGHSVKWLTKKELSAGAKIEVELKGNAVPQLKRVIEKGDDARWVSQVPPSGPVLCLYLSDQCSRRFLLQLQRFYGPKGLDIKGLNKTILRHLVDKGVVSRISDLFLLDTVVLSQSALMSRAEAADIVAALSRSRNKGFAEQLIAMGLPGMTKKQLWKLSDSVDSYTGLRHQITNMALQLPLKKRQMLQTLLTDDIVNFEELKTLDAIFMNVLH